MTTPQKVAALVLGSQPISNQQFFKLPYAVIRELKRDNVVPLSNIYPVLEVR